MRTIKKTTKKSSAKKAVKPQRKTKSAKVPTLERTAEPLAPAPTLLPDKPSTSKPSHWPLSNPAPVQTAEQIAGISKAANTFEGVKKIDHLPFEEQFDLVFNPLHTITKTAIGTKAVDTSTYIVEPKKK